MPESLTTNPKPFANDLSLFLVAHDSSASSVSLNNDLVKLSPWAYQRKPIFKPVVSKEAQEFVCIHIVIATNHATVYFNKFPLVSEIVQKHLSLCLGSKLNFIDSINEKIKKNTKGINVIRKMNLPLPRSFPFDNI